MILMSEELRAWGNVVTAHYTHPPHSVVSQVHLSGRADFTQATPGDPVFRGVAFFTSFIAGGAGTAGVHWSESVFGNELMTGFISGTPDPLSILTVGAMQDLGYTVNYSAADPYTMPAGHLVAGAGASTQTQALQSASAFIGEGPSGFDSTSEPLVLANADGEPW